MKSSPDEFQCITPQITIFLLQLILIPGKVNFLFNSIFGVYIHCMNK